MANFGLNDTIGVLMRVLQHHQEIIKLWHDTTALLVKLGLVQPGAVPMKASHAYDVEWVQQSLNQVGGAKLQVDGIMGENTVKAVKDYQAKHKLEADGWVGMLTVAQLETDLAGSSARSR